MGPPVVEWSLLLESPFSSFNRREVTIICRTLPAFLQRAATPVLWQVCLILTFPRQLSLLRTRKVLPAILSVTLEVHTPVTVDLTLQGVRRLPSLVVEQTRNWV